MIKMMMKGVGDTSFGSLIQTDALTVYAGPGLSFCCPECSNLLTYLLMGPVCVIPFLVLRGAVPWGQMDTGVSPGGLHIYVSGHCISCNVQANDRASKGSSHPFAVHFL